MSYTDAPACKLLATHCAVCRRPLLDAKSVEIGIGPTCRERHGYNAELGNMDEATRSTANAIIARIARKDVPVEDVAAGCAALRLMGLVKVPERIEFGGKDAPVEDEVFIRPSSRGTGFYVKAPYKPSAVPDWRAVPGRKWDGDAKENFVPTAARPHLWTLLRTHYAGLTLVLSDGETKVIPEPDGRGDAVAAYVQHVRDEREMQRIEAEGDRQQTFREELAKYKSKQRREAA